MEDSDDEHEEEVSAASRARLLDSYSEPEPPDLVAARAAIAPYVEDIDNHMRCLEELRRPRDYMPVLPIEGIITPDWRANLVDWLVEVADDLVLPADTLHLAVSCVDRFLSVAVIFLSQLRLLGVTALLVAAKYEDDKFIHRVKYYSPFTNYAYTNQQVVNMESDILNFLKFEIGTPTARTFLRRYITACRPHNHTEAKELEFLCSYLAELSLLDYDCTRFKPSVVAAACLFVARFIIRPNTYPWNLTLQRYTDYTISDLNRCILRIHDLQLKSRFMAEQSIHDKYNRSELEWVSEMDSPKDIPGHFLVD